MWVSSFILQLLSKRTQNNYDDVYMRFLANDDCKDQLKCN